ncbi:MAG: ABC transporter ATP-binding protein [Thermoplasmata archaeon]|nr:ABC transporter ATP-binding protein [Thermoplasmata archaeon]
MILRYLRRRDWAMVACCVALITGQVYLDLRIPEYMSEITYHLQAGTATEVIASCGVDMMACAFLSLGMAICTATLAARVASALCRTLRDRQFSAVSGWSRQDLDSFSVASLVTRSTNDVYHIQQFMARAINMVIKAPILAVWAVFKITSSAFEWTAVTALAMVILLVSMGLIMSRGIPYIRRMQWFVDAVNGETREELEGMRTIRAYNGEAHRTRSFEESSDNLLGNSLSAVHIMSPMHPLATSMMSFLTMAIYWVGAGLIQASAGNTQEQMLLFSDMIVFTSYATQVLSAVMMASGILRELPNVMVSSRRIEEVIEHEPALGDGALAAADASDPGEVSFEDVSFSYPGTGVEVLHGVSFSVRKGETLAIIGPTASGKSTLVNLIARLYDASSGRVTVGGRDVRDYSEDELSSMVGYVPQTAVVFSGTMRENVCYGGSSGKGDDEAMRAVRIAQLDDLVERLPNGLDSDVSQHGWNLSGGQKQRLSIARAVCKDPPIYIFDDTFSALDSRTDRNLRDALARETAGATKIIVAQRVGTILDADRIVVLDRGRVVGYGRHSELMEGCELYREIARSQLEDFDDER